jgi:hypothetical protein
MALFTVHHCCAVFSAGVDAVISFEITQCRAGPVTCSNINIGGVAYSIPLTSTNGGSTQGCLAATATTCPGAVEVATATVSPYEYPFFLLSKSGRVVQCRAGDLPAFDNGCSAVAGAGAFPVEIEQIGEDDKLAGCAATGPLTGCPAGYIGEYISASGATTITSCIPSDDCADGKFSLYDADAQLIGCAIALTACEELFSEAYIPMLLDTTPAGCMNPSSIKCPASTYTFSLYGGLGLVPVLQACEKPQEDPVCTDEYPIPIVSTFAAVTDSEDDPNSNPITVSAYNSHCTIIRKCSD